MTVMQRMPSRIGQNQPLGGEAAELFRVASVSQVLRNFAAVFASQGELSKASQHGVFGARHPSLDDVDEADAHQAADKLFFDQTLLVDKADFFISHVWTASRWDKALALHYYVNINFAVVAAFSMSFFGIVILEVSGGLDSHGEQPHLVLLVTYVIPLVVYIIVFLCGHGINPWALRTAWLDKLCVHQSRRDIQLQGIASLPEFVTRSKRLVILHSSTYFERLWCSLEVATFSAVCGPERVDFLPLWLVRWQVQDTLTNIIAMLLMHESTRVAAFSTAISGVGSMTAGMREDENAILWAVLEMFVLDIVSTFPILAVSYFAYWQKIRLHQEMTEQLMEYDFETLKCTVEADRELVRTEVERVFENQPNLGVHNDGQASPVARFSHFMKYEFRGLVSKQIGYVSKLPYTSVLLTNIPCILMFPANVLACSGIDCHEQARQEGFESVWQLFLCGTMTWIFATLVIWPCVHPFGLAAVLKSQESFEDMPRCQSAAGVLICFAGLIIANLECSMLQLTGALAVTLKRPVYILSYIILCFTYLCQCYCFFATTTISMKLRRLQFWFTVRATDWTYHHV